eukprot:102297_1
MGGFFAKAFEKMSRKDQIRMLMVGLDFAGKTTILYKLKLGEMGTTIPTIGFSVETVQYKNIVFTVWDVGGQDKIKPLWRHYYQNTQGIVFVVDSNDHERISNLTNEQKDLLCSGFIYEKHDEYIPNDMVNLCKTYFGVNKHDCQLTKIHCEECTKCTDTAQYELHSIAQEEELKDVIFLILANKQDLPNAMSVDEMKKRLLLNKINQQWHILPTIATKGDGVYEGLDWLWYAIKKQRDKSK